MTELCGRRMAVPRPTMGTHYISIICYSIFFSAQLYSPMATKLMGIHSKL